jgi:hypothetical protein
MSSNTHATLIFPSLQPALIGVGGIFKRTIGVGGMSETVSLGDSTIPQSFSKRVKAMRFRAGECPKRTLRIPGVSLEDEKDFLRLCRAYNMGVAVFIHYIVEAFKNNRLMFLPTGQTFDKVLCAGLLSGLDVEQIVEDAVDKRVREELGHTGLAEPYRR